jgi:hypothetical protein
MSGKRCLKALASMGTARLPPSSPGRVKSGLLQLAQRGRSSAPEVFKAKTVLLTLLDMAVPLPPHDAADLRNTSEKRAGAGSTTAKQSVRIAPRKRRGTATGTKWRIELTPYGELPESRRNSSSGHRNSTHALSERLAITQIGVKLISC